MPDLAQLQQRIGYVFKDGSLLTLALTHPSLPRDEATAAPPHERVPGSDNQRLEFLGDAVLQLVLAQELYQRFTGVDEGRLTKARALMVNTRALAEQARRLHLGDYLLLGRGEELHGGRQRTSALADAFEAVMGAVFIDGGCALAQQCALRLFQSELGDPKSIPEIDNPKGALQEYFQSRSAPAPTYAIVAARGPDHERVFECIVTHSGVEIGRGMGHKKQTSEHQAAQAALDNLRAQPGAVAPSTL